MLAMPEVIQPSPPSAAAVLDEACLQRLRELDPDGTSQVVERVLRAFEASLQRLLPQAVQALGQGDHHAVRHVVHTLKSSSASVGALELSQRCGDIENRLRAQLHEDLDTLLSGLNAEGERVLVALHAMLPG
jgi:HPt (histidine-containing phosphotransfer) domain-containing protein